VKAAECFHSVAVFTDDRSYLDHKTELSRGAYDSCIQTMWLQSQWTLSLLYPACGSAEARGSGKRAKQQQQQK